MLRNLLAYLTLVALFRMGLFFGYVVLVLNNFAMFSLDHLWILAIVVSIVCVYTVDNFFL